MPPSVGGSPWKAGTLTGPGGLRQEFLKPSPGKRDDAGEMKLALYLFSEVGLSRPC